MKKKTKLLIWTGVLVVLLVGAAVAYNMLSDQFRPQVVPDAPESAGAQSAAGESAQEEKPLAPDFTAYDGEGNAKKLSDYAGKPIVLNFWASWCPPCKDEMPHFQKLYDEMQDEVQFLMVDSVDGQRETEQKGKDYIAQEGYTFPVLYDNDQEGAYTYGVRSLPSTLFIDAEGYVVTGVEGALDEENLRKGVALINP